MSIFIIEFIQNYNYILKKKKKESQGSSWPLLPDVKIISSIMVKFE